MARFYSARLSKIALAALLALAASSLSAQGGASLPQSPTLVRSGFSLSAGYVSDYGSGHGWAALIRSMNFIAASPFYYGLGSTTGSFVSTNESIFETSAFFGYTAPLIGKDIGVDACLNVIAFGGRVDGATSYFRSEAPALQVLLGLTFPASEGIDVLLSAAPLFRPYDLENKEWNFSRSYMMLSLAVCVKSNLLVQKQPWSAQ